MHQSRIVPGKIEALFPHSTDENTEAQRVQHESQAAEWQCQNPFPLHDG